LSVQIKLCISSIPRPSFLFFSPTQQHSILYSSPSSPSSTPKTPRRMHDFPSLPSPTEEFKDLRKLYDRLLLSVFPISGYTLDRTHDPILTCNFHCARGLQRHVGFGACPFVIKAERASLKTPWTVASPLEYDHDHGPIPLSRPRRGTALAEALEKFGVGDEFWVNGKFERFISSVKVILRFINGVLYRG